MEIKAAIFDMDGTLVESLMIYRVCWQIFGEQFLGDPCFEPSPEIYREIATMTLYGAASYVNRYHKLGIDETQLEEFCNTIDREFYLRQASLKPGATELLESLKNKDVKMVLASATRIEMVKLTAEHLGIADYFEYIISCSEIGIGKDKPDIYLKAFDLLGVKPQDGVVVEDSFVALRTAKSIGAHTVGIFDSLSTGHDILKENSEIYIDQGGTLADLVGRIG